MTALSIIQDHCKLHALNVPTSVIGSTDTGTTQLLAILTEILQEIITESKFNVTTQEAIFATTPTEDQGMLTDLAPNGYSAMIFETFYDRSLMRPLEGPVSESDWQALKALPNAGAYYKFRIRQDHLLLYPAPSATSSLLAFEYSSSWAVKDSNGNLKATITADTDVFVFPEYILRKGVSWRWKHIKGLPYQEDEKRYYDLLSNYVARDKVKTRVNVANGPSQEMKPGIFVPSNSWMQ
jgi:hypothetical protein